MGLFDDIFYELVPDLVDVFVEDTELTTFRVTQRSVRPLAHPNDVDEYIAPRIIAIKCPPMYDGENKEDFGGQTRKDVTSRRITKFQVMVPAASVPAGVSLCPTQTNKVEVMKDGKYFEVKDVDDVRGSSTTIAFILHFGGA